MTIETLIAAQALWAGGRWPGHSSKRAPSLADNLVCPLVDDSLREFGSGSGGELGRKQKPGKMSSLRSSSALSFNVFGPWRGLDLQVVGAALQATVSTRSLQFEQKFRHGLSSTPPNVDVVLDREEPRPLGIECKFTEPYGRKKAHASLDAKYFTGNRSRWSDKGLPKCQALANAIGKTVPFTRLAAGQLLKHMLGLAHTTGESPRLRYVWYDTGCGEAREHREELKLFSDSIDPKVDFLAISYQLLVTGLTTVPEPVPGYLLYLRERYSLPDPMLR